MWQRGGEQLPVAVDLSDTVMSICHVRGATCIFGVGRFSGNSLWLNLKGWGGIKKMGWS